MVPDVLLKSCSIIRPNVTDCTALHRVCAGGCELVQTGVARPPAGLGALPAGAGEEVRPGGERGEDGRVGPAQSPQQSRVEGGDH